MHNIYCLHVKNSAKISNFEIQMCVTIYVYEPFEKEAIKEMCVCREALCYDAGVHEKYSIH